MQPAKLYCNHMKQTHFGMLTVEANTQTIWGTCITVDLPTRRSRIANGERNQ